MSTGKRLRREEDTPPFSSQTTLNINRPIVRSRPTTTTTLSSSSSSSQPTTTLSSSSSSSQPTTTLSSSSSSSKTQPTNDIYKDSYLYRALRPDEIQTYLNKNILEPPCNVCPSDNVCCNISASAHVNSGSKAKIKSRWISTTSDLKIAALWAARNQIQITSEHAPGRASGIVAIISPEKLNIVNPVDDPWIGNTAKNAAKSSKELLVKDKIPGENIVGIYQVMSVSKKEYDAYNGQKLQGKKKANSNMLYVVLSEPVLDDDEEYKEILKGALMLLSLKSHYPSDVSMDGGKRNKTIKYKKNKKRKSTRRSKPRY